MQSIDLVVLVIYLLAVTVLGAWAGRRISNVAEFFMPRRFGKATMMMHAFGTTTASDQAVTVAAATARNGLSGIWLQWMWLFSTPFYWLIAPIMRRFRAVTTADVYELRYDRSVSMLFAIVGIAGLAAKIGLMLKGAGALIDAGTGGMVDANWAIPVVTVLFVAYGTAGGLSGAIITDFVQGLMTIVFSCMLLPVVLREVGGLAGAKQTIRSASLDQDMLSLVAPGEIGVFFIVMISINSLFLIVASPAIMGNCAAGRTEMDGRVGFMFGTLVKRACTIAWCLTSLAAVAWYLNRGIDLSTVDPDMVYGDVAYRFLPQVLPGMLGIFIASLLAAVMSSCDSFMIASSGLFTQNIYQPYRPGRTQQHYLLVGRLGGLAVVAAGIAIAYQIEGVVAGLKLWYKIVPMMGIAFWLGLLWRRTNVAGAWASVIAGFATWWLATRAFFVDWLVSLQTPASWRLLFDADGTLEVYEPWLILMYLSAGLLAGVAFSLLTSPIAAERLERYYELTRTPIAADEVLEKPCQLPAGTPPANRKMLTTAFGLEVPLPSRTSVAGFLAGWAVIGGLIGSFAWLVSG